MGGADPTMNARLFTAVEKAKKESVTKDAIQRAINKGAGIGDEKLIMEHVVFEGYAPHKVPLIVEVYTDNVNRTAPEIRVLFKKGQLGVAGSNKFLFDHVGLVEAHHPDAKIDREAAAIEAGANDYISKPIDLRVLMARLKVQIWPYSGPIAVVERDELAQAAVHRHREPAQRTAVLAASGTASRALPLAVGGHRVSHLSTRPSGSACPS